MEVRNCIVYNVVPKIAGQAFFENRQNLPEKAKKNVENSFFSIFPQILFQIFQFV